MYAEHLDDRERRSLLVTFAVCAGVTLLAVFVLYLMWASIH